MKFTPRQLFKKISYIYENLPENSSNKTFNIVKSGNFYYVQLVDYISVGNTKYTSFYFEKISQKIGEIQTHNYQTIIKISYGYENSRNSEMVPVRFRSDEVITPPLIEQLVSHIRNFDIDNIINSCVGS